MKTLNFQYNIPIKGVKKKTICQFSDVHLTAWDELSTAEEVAEAKYQTRHWIKCRRDFAIGKHESYEIFQQADALTNFERLTALASSADAAVLCGDIMDYVSGANIRAVEKGLKSLNVPYVYVSGNHEEPWYLPDGSDVSIIKKPIYSVDLGDLQIIGIDNSQRKISEDQLKETERLLATKKCSVIAMHVPIMTEGNRKKLTAAGEYFQLNYNGCPAENLEFISMITNTDYNVAAVLTGHLHFGNVSEIGNGVFQYGSSQGILANANLITIGE